jgi:hypothetical protein
MTRSRRWRKNWSVPVLLTEHNYEEALSGGGETMPQVAETSFWRNHCLSFHIPSRKMWSTPPFQSWSNAGWLDDGTRSTEKSGLGEHKPMPQVARTCSLEEETVPVLPTFQKITVRSSLVSPVQASYGSAMRHEKVSSKEQTSAVLLTVRKIVVRSLLVRTA